MILPTLYSCSGNWGLERLPKVADNSMCRQGGRPLLHTARPKGVSTGDSRAGTSSVDESFLMMEGLLHLQWCAGRYGMTSAWRQNQRPSEEWLALSLSCFLRCSFLFISQTLLSSHPWPFPLEVPGILTLGLVSLQVPGCLPPLNHLSESTPMPALPSRPHPTDQQAGPACTVRLSKEMKRSGSAWELWFLYSLLWEELLSAPFQGPQMILCHGLSPGLPCSRLLQKHLPEVIFPHPHFSAVFCWVDNLISINFTLLGSLFLKKFMVICSFLGSIHPRTALSHFSGSSIC